MRRLSVVCTLIVFAACSTILAGYDRQDEVSRLKRSSDVFNEIMASPEKGIPEELLDRCECVAIVPSVTKGGFVVGGRYGKGVVMCRRQDHRWTAPSFLTIEGGSVGLQIGLQKIDLVMVVMNRRGMEKLIGDKFTIGADASAAAGPVGRHASAETDLKMAAEILTYSRARGLFAGITLNGAVVKQDKDDNRDFYGREVSAREILLDGTVPTPIEAESLAVTLSRTSPMKKK